MIYNRSRSLKNSVRFDFAHLPPRYATIRPNTMLNHNSCRLVRCRVLRIILATSCILIATASRPADASAKKNSDSCRFPVEWRGRYFQSGLGEIVIRENVMTTKGTCVERSQDYYLFENRENNCFQCLLLLRQHRNVIQYKESYCTSSSVLRTVCTQLRVEAPLYTLVREQSSVVKCPFSDAYYFNYNDLVHGSCPRALSYAKPCSGQTKYQLRFNHCVDTAMFNGKDLDLECLATWKDGSEMYLYGRLNGAGLLDKDDRYRCFKYQHYGSDLQLAMSADATCRGLRSATDGPFLIEFSRDTAGWPSPSCQYPDWLRSVTWRDLEDQWRLSVDDNGQTLQMTSQIAPSTSSSGKQRSAHMNDNNEYRCRQLDASGGSDVIVVHAFAIQNCVAKYQCLKIRRLSSQAVEVRQGTVSDHDSHSRCMLDLYKHVHVYIPTAGALTLTQCPRSAVYHTAPSDGCLHRLTVGCQNESIIVINHSCSPNSAGMSLECLASWNNTANTSSYVVVRQQHTSLIECFSYRLEGGKPVFGTDVSCSGNTTSTRRRDHLLNYSITRSELCRNNVQQRTPAIGAGGQQNSVTMAMTTRNVMPISSVGRSQRPHVRTTTTTRPPTKPPTPLPTRKRQQIDDESDEDYDNESDDVADRKYDSRFEIGDEYEASGDERRQMAPADSVRPKHVGGRQRSPALSAADEYVDEREVDLSSRTRINGNDRAQNPSSPEVKRPHGATEASRRRETVTSGRTIATSSTPPSWRHAMTSSWRPLLTLLCLALALPS